MVRKSSLVVFCIFICLFNINKSFAILKKINDIEIRSPNRQLNIAFEWAKKKARFYVQTGKYGKVDQSERSVGSRNVFYIPSYWAGYPFRSAFYIRDYCHQMVGAHLLGLDEENFQMLLAFTKSATEKRKWYPLWSLNFDGSAYSVDYKNDSDFVREIPAVFELVEKAYKQYLWTGDVRLLNNPILWNYYRKVVTDFVRLHDTLRPNGVAEGSGTGDIFKGIATYNEGVDKFSCLEAGDGISCQYQAYLSYAALLNAKNDTLEARIWKGKAQQLKNYFETVWSKNSKNKLYSRGYDIHGNIYWNFGKETSWFMPMKLITDNDKRNELFLDFITKSLKDNKNIPSNIESISYLPDLYFSYGRIEQGWQWTQYILDSYNKFQKGNCGSKRGDYPEISYTLISNVVENLMGIESIASQRKFSSISRLPKTISYLEVKNIPIGKNLVSVRHNGMRETMIKNVKGEDITCNVRFYGNYSSLIIDGKKEKAKHDYLNGKYISYCTVIVHPSRIVDVKI